MVLFSISIYTDTSKNISPKYLHFFLSQTFNRILSSHETAFFPFRLYTERGFLLPFIHIRRISLGKRIQPHEREQSVQHQQFVSETITIGRNGPGV